MRINLQQLSESRCAEALGLCGAGNLRALASYVNEATERLLYAFGETGPFGCWDKAAFRVLREDPYITLPTGYARAVNLDICRVPVKVQNEFVEFLDQGIGLQTICDCSGVRAAYDRNNFPTAYDLPTTNQYLRLYATDSRDFGQTIIFSQAKDQNGNYVYETSGLNQVTGAQLILANPFATTTFIVTSFANIIKPVTFGDVVLRAVDATTGAETFLARYLARETTPVYRRYFLEKLPQQCCMPGFPATDPPTSVITAMLKKEWTPATQPSDMLLISSIAALKEACLAVKYGECDSANGQGLNGTHWKSAIKLLNDQLTHYLGSEQPAINVRPYQSEGLNTGGWGTCADGWNLQMI